MKKRPNPWNPERKRGYADPSRKSNAFYNQNRWKTASRRWRDNHPECSVVTCRELVSTVTGQRRRGGTDHIIPIEQGGAGFDKRNYQSLCTSHHAKKSLLEARYVVLYESEHNEKGNLIPIRDDEGRLIPILGRGGEFLYKMSRW